MSNEEYHVASFVAHTLPENIQALSQFIDQQPCLEVHAINETGKIVFTSEGSSQKEIANNTEIIKSHTQVLTLSPVYHQFLNEAETSNINKDEL